LEIKELAYGNLAISAWGLKTAIPSYFLGVFSTPLHGDLHLESKVKKVEA